MKKRTADLLAGGLAVLAILAAAGIALFVYRQTPHIEDEFAYLWQAKTMAQGKLSLPSPVEPKSQLVPFVIDYEGQRFGKYPPGWPALLSLGARLGLAGWVNPLLTGVAIWLMYRLGSRVKNERLGLLASLLLLSSPMFLLLAGSLMAHLWSLVLVLVFCLAWFGLFLDGGFSEAGSVHTMQIAAAGCCLGLLAVTRPLTAVGVALPFFIHGLTLLIRGSRTERQAVLLIGLQAAIFCLILPLWQAALTGDPRQNLYTLWWPYDRYGFGAGVGVTESGHSLRLAWMNIRISLKSGAKDLFGWFSFSWILMPFGLLAYRRNRKQWLLLGSTANLILVYGGYWVGSWLYGPRYYFEGIPAACILTAAGVEWLAGWGIQAQGKWQPARRWLAAGLLAVLTGINVFGYLPARLLEAGSINGMSADNGWLLEELDSDPALVFIETRDSWWEYGLYVPLAPPFSKRPLQAALDRGMAANQLVIEGYPGWRVYHVDLSSTLLPGVP
ncbi:MAG: hypothetical protein JXA25_17900 [Anaerolineales bacterium]|nr:hypothetical protein [Anaerolineales bacterium]